MKPKLPTSSARPGNVIVTMALAATLALFVACGGDEEAVNTGGPARHTVAVTASDFSYSPGTLTVQASGPFDIVLTNAGDAPHTFTIDELGVDAEVAAGEETIVPIAPSESGEFTFYCRFHRGQGMEGDITVSGPVSGGGGDTGSTPAESPDDDPTESPENDDPYYNY